MRLTSRFRKLEELSDFELRQLAISRRNLYYLKLAAMKSNLASKEQGAAGITKETFSIRSDEMNKVVRDFTLHTRPWPAYDPLKLEIMLRWAGKLPNAATYSGFDPDQEILIFVLITDTRFNRFLRRIGWR